MYGKVQFQLSNLPGPIILYTAVYQNFLILARTDMNYFQKLNNKY